MTPCNMPKRTNSSETFYNRLGRPLGDLALPIRRQDVLRDTKWKKFLSEARRFRYIPFADFVFASGSMVIGNVKDSSDFDVIVGARHGRIFTVRFFSIILFGLLNERRKKLSHDEEAKDKLCFNHFVTEKSLRLSPPHHLYWHELYARLVPLYGEPAAIQKFFDANDWLPERRAFLPDTRHFEGSSAAKKVFERVLGGKLGDALEAALRKIQLSRINRSMKKEIDGFRPRIRVSDDELEFHPDQKVYKLMRDLETI